MKTAAWMMNHVGLTIKSLGKLDNLEVSTKKWKMCVVLTYKKKMVFDHVWLATLDDGFQGWSKPIKELETATIQLGFWSISGPTNASQSHTAIQVTGRLTCRFFWWLCQMNGFVGFQVWDAPICLPSSAETVEISELRKQVAEIWHG